MRTPHLKISTRLLSHSFWFGAYGRISAAGLLLALILTVHLSIVSAQNPPAQNTPANTPPPAGARATPRGSATGQPPADAKPSPTPTPTPPNPEVTNVYNAGYPAGDKKNREKAGLNDIIIVEVKALGVLLRKRDCLEPFKENCRPDRKISLFIDGREIEDLAPESGDPTIEHIAGAGGAPQYPDGELRFHLARNDLNSENWADLLGLRIEGGGWGATRPIQVSVGLNKEAPITTNVKPGGKSFSLIRFRLVGIILWILGTILALGLLLWAAKRYDMLCDRAPVIWPQKRPYSLSACQAAWWFIVILISFFFVWLVTGQVDFSSTALILLAIGSGTALGSTVIDSSKRSQTDAPTDDTQLQKLLAEKQQIEAQLSARRGNAQAFAATKTEYDQKIAEIRASFPNAIGPGREGLLVDILSDSNGVNFHRFQMAVWTVALSFYFVIAALGRLAMPDFSATLLGLMGIGAGTYLGFKIPEQNNLNSSATPPPGPPPPPANPPGNQPANQPPRDDEEVQD